MSAADELRTAAAKLRALAEASTPGNWWAEELPPNEHHKHPAHWVKTEYEDGPSLISSQVIADCPWKQADAAYIATMHPGVGKALADWLDYEADLMGPGSERRGRTNHPLALARLINTGNPT
ncbi:hypothetical protein AB0I27_22860 [Streptomyces sp. NPDC050597]|uniref:hypothetical protein n=1 Tax=Streptomyces sp. NPDC050597 TaxID=3157212 RepID=UPI003449D16B